MRVRLPGDLDGTGLDACACGINPDCACRGEGPVVSDKEVAVDVLKKLTEVDILGTELAQSGYTWLRTYAGIDFLTIGQDDHLFLLPSPKADGYFVGRVTGRGKTPAVQRLDGGAVDAAAARLLAEQHADLSGYQYSNRKASWRRTPASDAQKGLLRNRGVEIPDGLRKGEASDMLSVNKVSPALDPRFGKYVTGA